MEKLQSTPKIELKNLKHQFTQDERNQLGGDLARAIAGLRGIEGDFDNVKAGFKAKITAAESQIDNLSTSLMNGFEMRNKRCVVIFRPKDREKDFFLEELFGKNGNAPVATEPMTPQDFQAELIEAESKFDNREEIELFKPAEGDTGTLIVGRLAGKWFSALRVKIGKMELNERLDAEQKCFKERSAAVAMAVKRFNAWAKENLKELAAGFAEAANAVVEAHKERAE